ncbi:MAG: ribosome-associated translation inhibitor RaiA [Rhodospirillales bacterium]|nr:ribosome-associated translation inhibitor RaiA [Rhodospirillales bacterium]
MQTALQVVFHGMDHSDALEQRIFEEFKKLEKFHQSITDCRVTIEAPHRHHRKGKLYDIAINLDVPGGGLTARTGGSNNPAHADPGIALRDVFQTITRQLKELSERQNAHRA